ncbi:hypothetical protein BDR07DRAFT_1495481 [Suillus spraguei]|nr:hypothetical protein BDR07DRAFT_1495481 [Suillus spraguei]
MTSRRVHFSSPLATVEQQNMASESKCSINANKDQAPVKWWVNCAPIDERTPEFRNLEFRRYDMSSGPRIETLNNHLGYSSPGAYERTMAGVQDSIMELAGMLDEEVVARNRAQSTAIAPSADSADDVDELMNDETPSYDLGWGTAFDANEAGASDSNNGSAIINSPSYDLGWNAAPTENAAVAVGSAGDSAAPVCDLGWNDLTTENPDIVANSSDGSTSPPAYDLGWMAPALVQNTGNCYVHPDDPVYDLGWGPVTPVDQGATETEHDLERGGTPPGEQAAQPNVIDLTGDDIPEIIDLTDGDGPTYDFGWRPTSSRKETSASSGAPASTSAVPMELNGDDDAHLFFDPVECMKFRRNRRMKAIGNDMDDEHVHAIVENAVHGLNDSRTPSQVLIDNRRILGSFANARDRVTDAGRDMCKLHRMLQLQRRMVKTLDEVIGALEYKPEWSHAWP